MKGYRRNAIVDQQLEPPAWLVVAIEEAQRQYDEAPWWKRLYWRASVLFRRVTK